MSDTIRVQVPSDGILFIFRALERWEGNCTECGEPADTDRQTIELIINISPAQHFHQTCAWKRATFIFGELF